MSEYEEWDMGSNGIRAWALLADDGGSAVTPPIGFVVATTPSYVPPTGSPFVAGRDYFLWVSSSTVWPATFWLQNTTLDAVAFTVSLALSGSSFNTNLVNLPNISTSSSTFWQAARRRADDTMEARDVYLEHGSSGVTWWARGTGTPAEINTNNNFTVVGQDPIRFTTVTSNPSVSTNFRKCSTPNA